MRKKRQFVEASASDNFLQYIPNGFDLNGNYLDSFQDVDLTGFLPQSKTFEPECPNRDGPEICDEHTPFRTHSGYCNNLKNPHLGKSLATFSRLLPSMYENGNWKSNKKRWKFHGEQSKSSLFEIFIYG